MSTGSCRASRHRLATRSAAISSCARSARRRFAGRWPMPKCAATTTLFSAQAAKSGQVPRRCPRRRRGDAAVAEVPVSRREPVASGHYRDYAIASRLSYLLWDTMPDRALFDAAAKGELRTPEGVERIARTHARSTPCRQATDEFFAQWLRFDRVLGAVKDRRRYPEFTPELAAMMVQETRMLLGNLVWNDGNFMDAFTAGLQLPECRTSRRLYGCAGACRRVRDGAVSGRMPGVPGFSVRRRSWLRPPVRVETSPTARGMFMREQLLCQRRAESAAGREHELPEPTADTGRCRCGNACASTWRIQLCSAATGLMDPIGFGLENYDAIGGWRDKEDGRAWWRGGARQQDARAAD